MVNGRYRLVIEWKRGTVVRHLCENKYEALATRDLIKQFGLNAEKIIFPRRMWLEECNKYGI